MDTPKLQRSSRVAKALLVLLNCIFLSIGQIAGPLLSRLYYVHGGKRKWLASWLLTAGFPMLIIPIAISCTLARNKLGAIGLLLTPRMVAATAVLGSLLGLDSYLYTFGMSYLPLSVSSLLGSTQLAFTAIFAYIVVRHKFTHFSINAVVLMTFGSVILGLQMNGDRPDGESRGKYIVGYAMTLMGAALHGLLMPAVEYTHLEAGITVTFDVVMQFQFLVSAFATLFCTVAMIINNDFQAIPKEAAKFGLGETRYYMIIGLAAIALQLMIIGSLGLIFCSTSLFGGIVTSLLVPVQQVFAVMFLHERFSPEKGMALAMCLWGFASYFYGEYEASRKNTPATQEDADQELV